MKEYLHKVQYYETDRMGITHHSNYIRWMEEARVAYLEQIGWGYDRFEAEGIVSPVIEVNCQFRKATTFPEIISIIVSVEECRGIRLRLHYEMKNEAGDVVATGTSSHCFTYADGGIINIKKSLSEFYEILMNDTAD